MKHHDKKESSFAEPVALWAGALVGFGALWAAVEAWDFRGWAMLFEVLACVVLAVVAYRIVDAAIDFMYWVCNLEKGVSVANARPPLQGNKSNYLARDGAPQPRPAPQSGDKEQFNLGEDVGASIFDTLLLEEQPKTRENFAKYPDMMVCSTCFQIYGFGDYISPRFEHWQKCDCSNKVGMPEDVDEKWRWKDFNKLVELCYCCGKRLVHSGSKWSLFFCEECKWMVVDFDRQYGRVIIPIGRHSLVNGSILRGQDHTGDGLILSNQDVQDDVKLKQYSSRVNGMVASIKHLEQWSRLEVGNRFTELETIEDITLRGYGVLSSRVDKPETFGRLVQFFRSK